MIATLPLPVQGVGIQLLNTSPAWYSRPDTYIGRVNDGLTADPLKPGEVRTYSVRVTDTGNIPEKIDVYPAAASVSNGAWLPTYTGKNLASSWTSVSPSSLPLNPGQGAVVTVTIRVPAKTAAGTQYGVVWAGPVNNAAGQVKLNILAGIREYLTVK